MDLDKTLGELPERDAEELLYLASFLPNRDFPQNSLEEVNNLKAGDIVSATRSALNGVDVYGRSRPRILSILDKIDGNS